MYYIVKEDFPCHCPDAVQHILMYSADLCGVRIEYYNSANMIANLFNENILNIINN